MYMYMYMYIYIYTSESITINLQTIKRYYIKTHSLQLII